MSTTVSGILENSITTSGPIVPPTNAQTTSQTTIGRTTTISQSESTTAGQTTVVTSMNLTI